ncbi:MAG: excinuclease ABC subunit UvrA, partial [Luteolibacter sp.]
TLYAEGQRRYVETFSPYVRQFFDRMDKPDVDSIEGIPPAIAIEQKNHVRSTRSTVGTLTEIHDYLKLLFARCATGHDPKTGEEIRPDSVESAAAWALENHSGKALLVTFPIQVPPGTQSSELFPFLNSQGYLRILLNGEIIRTDEPHDPARVPHSIDVVQDRLTLGKSKRTRLHEALEAAFHLGKGMASIVSASPDTEFKKTFSTNWTNPSTGFSLRPPSPALFSFNSPLGACPHCRGFGRVIGIDLEKAVPDPTLSIAQGAIRPFQGERGSECQRDLLRNCRERGVDINTPWDELTPDEHEWIYYGDHGISTSDDENALERLDEVWQSGGWYGVKGFFDWLETKSYKMHVRVFLSRYRSHTSCPSCRGKRLQPESLCFKIEGRTLPDISAMPVCDLLPWFDAFAKKITSKTSKDPSLKVVLSEIHSRLHYLNEVGLGYLTLDRQTRTLSGGEVSRVNLTACLGASLTGTLFVLDEPTVGLHPRDVDRLTAIMHLLRDKGNTLVVVEHENAVMRAADHLLDLGPAAGQHGGQLIYHGPPNPPPQRARTQKTKHTQVGTLPWLNGEKSIPVPQSRRRPDKQFLKIRGASCHNLRKLDVDLPLGVMTCLTGVSGSGKSTLAHQVIYENVARKLGIETQGDPASLREVLGCQFLSGIEMVDQSAVARTPRSTPALFLGAFDPIRQLFACTSAAKAAGVQAGFFSFNSGDGRCDRCAGNGFEKVEMQFLSDLYVSCPACDGRRYKPSTLEFLYRGKSIHDILSFTVTEAISFYQDLNDLPASHVKRHLAIIRLLTPLVETGLGYLKLGQPLNTLSGGESQRLKLCQLLQSSQADATQRGGQLLILDEPTTGLHFSDIDRLLKVFHHLTDLGHTLLVIEHNLDVIKSADWIIDLGPEAGNGGGQVVACGPPEDVAKQNSPTGRYLRSALADKVGKTNQSGKKTHSRAKKTASLISLRGARHHNLKNLSLDIPRDQLVVISGLSGSGKSTLAFDILFAEGQRRFLDSMSTYARQFAEQLEKPEIDQIQGLPPTVAIEQRVSQGGRKSTVATVTEIWNFIRLLYAKLGTLHCPDCQIPVEKQSLAAIENTILKHLKNGPVTLLAPVVRGRKGYHTDVAEWALKQGFSKLLVDRQIRDTDGFKRLERFKEHDIDIVVAELVSGRHKKGTPPLGESVAKALEIGKGILRLITPDKKLVLLSTKSSCPSCNRSFDDLDPRMFSFNSPQGWCPDCRGHGLIPNFQLHLDTSRFDSVLEAELDA